MLSTKSYFGRGHVPVGIGAVLRGWDMTEKEFRKGLGVVDFRAMTGACPRDCFFCFTNKDKRTLALGEIKRVIDEIAEMGAHAIDFLGEGEPTVDKWFFDIIEHTASHGLIPVVFTEAAARMRNRDFVKRVKAVGATVCPKCDSLFTAAYQNQVVGDKKGTYFAQRNEAVQLLIEEGFNEANSDGTTRLGFDMVVSARNIHEVSATLRYCRERNIWVVFSFYLPAGRSARSTFDQNLRPSEEQKRKMRAEVLAIDREFGFEHTIFSNFATTPCVERLQIYGDGRVSPCPGNETVLGTVQESSIRELHQKLLARFPGHDPARFDGHCLYRPKVPGVDPIQLHRKN